MPNIASKINNVEYAINSFDTLVNNQIPLQIKTRTLGIFNLTFIGVNNFIPNMVFKDNATQTLINIATDTTIKDLTFHSFANRYDELRRINPQKRFWLRIRTVSRL